MSLLRLVVLMHGTLLKFALCVKTATIAYRYRKVRNFRLICRLDQLVVQRLLLSLKQLMKQNNARPVSHRQNIVRSVTSKPEFVLNVSVLLHHLLSP